jgi:hypothetical protein
MRKSSEQIQKTIEPTPRTTRFFRKAIEPTAETKAALPLGPSPRNFRP